MIFFKYSDRASTEIFAFLQYNIPLSTDLQNKLKDIIRGMY